MKKVLGLDLSISCTGVAGAGWVDVIPTPAYTKRTGKTADPIQEERNRVANQHKRLDLIMEALSDHLTAVDLVVIEDMAYEARDLFRQNAGLAWLVRHRLVAKGIPYALVPATNLKLYATGKGSWGAGGNGKHRVMEAVESWYPGLLEEVNANQRDNAADAAVLAAMGYAYIGTPVVEVGERNLTALEKCFWPELISDEGTPHLASEHLGALAA